VCCTPQIEPFLHHTKSKKQDFGEESMELANGFLDLVVSKANRQYIVLNIIDNIFVGNV
jgi:hypothetical protein